MSRHDDEADVKMPPRGRTAGLGRTRGVALATAAAALLVAVTACTSATPQATGAPSATGAPTVSATGATTSATTTTATAAPTPGATATAAPADTPPPPSPTPGVAPSTNPASTNPPSACPAPSPTVITRAPGAGRTVALTFDDGGSADMLAIAEILRAQSVGAATFFNTGANDAQNPQAVTDVAAMGFLIGNHTWDHQYPKAVPGGWSIPYLSDQISRTAAQIQSLTGAGECFFRPPGGAQDNVLAAATAQGMSVVMWSVDTSDWQSPPRLDPAFQQRIIARATTLPAAGADHPIVLMHSAKASHEPEQQVSSFRGNTVAALPSIIAWYRSHGYRFVDLTGRS